MTSTTDKTETVAIRVNGRVIEVRADTSVAAAIVIAGDACRMSVSGQPRGPLCGMGICMECRATVDGVPQMRTCQVMARNGMTVVTG